MNTPNVESFSATDKAGRPVRFTIATDIIDYMESSETFGREHLADPGAHGRFQRRIVALPDRKSAVVTPLVLTLSSQNGLYLVRREEGSASESGGWQLTDLGAAFNDPSGSARQVRAFDAGWTADDRLTLAVAVDDTPSGRSRVFVAYDLSSRATDWSSIPWQDCGARDEIRVEGIRVLDSGDGQWTVVLAGNRGPNEMLYLLDSQSGQAFEQATVFNPAVTLEEILDFQAVLHPTLGGGIAVLGTNGGTRDLSFRSFPTAAIPVPAIVPLPCPDGANVLEAGITRPVGRTGHYFATDLFIGGQGIQLIPADQLYAAENARITEIAGPAAAPAVQDVLVAEAPDGSASVWGLLQNGSLIVVRRAAGAAAWGTPLRLRSGVQEVAPVQGSDHSTTSVLVVYSDGKAAWLWQDARTGAWHEAPLHVANPDQVSRVTCYGTSLRYLDGDGLPQFQKKVSVSGSVLASVVLNGKTVFIGPNLPVEAETDSNGGIHLYDRARSLTPAVYRFAFGDLGDVFDVNPAACAHKRFQQIEAGELRGATVTMADGKTEPLLGPEFAAGGANAGQVEGAAAALNRVSKLVTTTKDSIATGVNRVQPDGKFSSSLQNSTLPTGYRVGIRATAAGVQVLDSGATNALLGAANSVAGFFTDLGDSIADFFEGIAHRIKQGWEFVVHKVEEGWKFVCKIGEEVKDFVLDTLEQIGGFFTWLWEQIKTGLEKLWEFLKFLFEWEDILTARNVMVKATEEALLYLEGCTEQLKETAASGFQCAIDQIREWQTELGEPPAQIPSPAPGASISDRLKSPSPEQQRLHDRVTGHSVIGWVMGKLDSVIDQIVHIEMEDLSENAQHGLSEFASGLTAGELAILADTWAQIKATVLEVFEKKMPAMDSLSIDTFKHLIIRVGAEILVGLLESVQNLTLRSIDFLGALMEVFRKALFARISFPFIERLIELVLPMIHVDTSFRMIDGILLLVSIPATIGYKLIFGHAPFKKGEMPNLALGRVAVQSAQSPAFTAYAGLAGGFLKLCVAGVKMIQAFRDEKAGVASRSKWFVPVALAFSALGVAGEVLGRHDPEKEQDGDAIGKLELVGIATLVYCFLQSAAFALGRWQGFDTAYEGDALYTIVGNTCMILLGLVVFGLMINNLSHSSVKDEELRQGSESFRWIGRTSDQVGNIVFAVATVNKEVVTKALLCEIGAYLKAISFGLSIGDVTYKKVVLS